MRPWQLTEEELQQAKRGRWTKVQDAVNNISTMIGPEWINTVEHPEARAAMVQRFNAEQRDLVIAPSKHGLGLFARRPYAKGEYVGVYVAPAVPADQADDLPDHYDRNLEGPQADITLAGDWMDPDAFNYCSFINDPGFQGTKKSGWIMPVDAENVRPSIVNGMLLVFRCTKPVAAGEEFYFFYGAPYWYDEHRYWPEKRFVPTLPRNIPSHIGRMEK